MFRLPRGLTKMPRTFDFTQQVAVRLTDEDLEAFKAAAAEFDMSVAEFLRATALFYLCTQLKAHGLKELRRGVGASIRDAIARLREPGLRKIVFGWKKSA
jgi:hypothetical protein